MYNYLFAKKNNGVFILRIEDTDQNRFVPGAEEYIIESLNWCGIYFDEGAEHGGPHAPYRQSERKELYRQYVLQLVENGTAYYAFDTPEELDIMRTRLEEDRESNTSYNNAVRMKMKNSLSLPQKEVMRRIRSGDPYVIRFKMPADEIVKVTDSIRGDVTVNTSTLDDKVLLKPDGMPTYHLANVVDDHLMEISHVIRGEEWLPSLPLHVLLYRAFGWEMPDFAHLPLLLKPGGNGKLSKRDGDKLGFPVFPLEWQDPATGERYAGYRETGYFPEAFINMLALLGWNPGTEKELFTMQELICEFTLDRVSKSGARFDPEKAKWFNHQYMMSMDEHHLMKAIQPILEAKGINTEDSFTAKVCALVKERVNLIPELWEQSFFFFEAPGEYDPEVIKKKWKENTPDLLKHIAVLLESLEPFNRQTVEPGLKTYLEKKTIGFGQVMNVLRLILVGSAMGPDLFDIMTVLGKEETVRRIISGINTIAAL